MTANSTRLRRRRKTERPDKPKGYKDFPLYAHPLGYWAKKINGKLYYFGRWGRIRNGKMVHEAYEAGWRAALDLFRLQRDDLFAGRTPQSKSATELTVKSMCDQFLTAKSRKVDSGELAKRTLVEYTEFCQRMADEFGKSRHVSSLRPVDFEKLRAEAARVWGPHRLGKFVQYIRTAFKYAYDSELIKEPTRFGPEFKRPNKDAMRKHRNEQGERYFTAPEIRKLISAASPQLKAMIFLGINCGYGNSDVACLQRAKLDLAKGSINFPRPKTGVERRCPLWPKTIRAIKAALAVRPRHKDEVDADCVFITVRGNRWLQEKTNSVGLEFGKLLVQLKISGRSGLSFYSLRRTFRTVADAAKDQPATDLIMGHVDPSMGGIYRQHIDDVRLVAVVDHVHRWLFGNGGAK